MNSHQARQDEVDQLRLAIARLQQENIQLQAQLAQQSAETRDAVAEALNASRAKSDFLAMMSHEIRTPMNAILGYTQLLLKYPLESRLEKYVHRIHASGEGLLQIINDILDFSKIEAGKLALETISFHLVDLFDQLEALFKQQALAKGIILDFKMEDDIPRSLLGDPLRIGQIITNLVSNALKFTEKGKISVHARLRRHRADECLIEIECSDTGIGIAPAMQQRLFSPFTQADSSTTRQYGGTGLGLSICRRLANMMGGDIQLTSAVGQGSQFTVTLLLKRTDQEDVESSDSAADDQNLQRFAGLKLLLVEDNELNQELVCDMLAETGLLVDVAGNGLEALEKLKVNQYDAVLMDMQMPLIDGLETTRRLREDVALADLPVVALTANATIEDRTECLASGMNDFLSKPVSAPELLKTLDHWLLGLDASVEVTTNPVVVSNTLNIAKALDMMGGKTALLDKMLSMFTERYADSDRTLLELHQQGDQEVLQRFAHTLKGIAANIAAEDLHFVASRIDSCVKKQCEVGEMEKHIADYSTALQQLLASINTHLQGK